MVYFPFIPDRKLVTDPRVKLKYQHLITNSFVEVSQFDSLRPTSCVHDVALIFHVIIIIIVFG